MDRNKTLLKRILEEIELIDEVTSEIEEEDFLSDKIIQHAVCMSLITIGECANHLSEEFIEANSQIAWFEIIAVRNISAHGYWQLDMRQIWKAAIEDIPILKEFLLGEI